MARNFSARGFTGKAASVSPHVSSVPGSSAKARINEAAGQKVTTAAVASSKALPNAPAPASSSGNMVMPVDHPGAKTTRTTTKGGML
jgi:hypothetical protein